MLETTRGQRQEVEAKSFRDRLSVNAESPTQVSGGWLHTYSGAPEPLVGRVQILIENEGV